MTDATVFRSLPHGERLRVALAVLGTLLDDFDAIAGEDLARPAVGEWSVGEVLAHLTVVAGFYRDNIGRGLAGDTSPSDGRPSAGTGTGAAAAEGIATRASAAATDTAGDARMQLRRNVEQLAGALATLGPHLDAPCYHPGGIVPANRFALLALKEFGIHHWDVFQALDPPAVLPGVCIEAILWAIDEDLASASLRWSRAPNWADDLTVRVRVAAGTVWVRDLRITADTVEVARCDADAESTVSMTGQQFILAAYGRGPWSATSGRTESTELALSQLASAFRGP